MLNFVKLALNGFNQRSAPKAPGRLILERFDLAINQIQNGTEGKGSFAQDTD